MALGAGLGAPLGLTLIVCAARFIRQRRGSGPPDSKCRRSGDDEKTPKRGEFITGSEPPDEVVGHTNWEAPVQKDSPVEIDGNRLESFVNR